MGADIQEQHDVTAKHPGIVKQMKMIVKKEHHMAEVNTFSRSAIKEGFSRIKNY